MGRASALSYLPSMLLPCPACGSRFELKTIERDPIAQDLDNITHACVQCGTELTRTVLGSPGRHVDPLRRDAIPLKPATRLQAG